MKIIYIVDFEPFIEDLSGAAKIIYHSIKDQSLRNEVSLLLINADDYPVPETFFNVKSIMKANLILSPPKPYLVKPFPEYSLAQVRQLDQAYQLQQYDLIHTTITLRNIGKLHPAVVYGIHDSFSLAVRRDGSLRNALKAAYWRVFELTHRSRNCAVTFVADQDAKRYNPLLKKLILVNGVDSEKYAPVQHPKVPNSFVFHGVLDYQPNIDTVSYTARMLEAHDPNARLYLVGRLNRISEQQYLQWVKMFSNCSYIGPVADISDEIAKYQFCILLMQSGSGIKNKLLEALSTGCVVITNHKALNGLINLQSAVEAVYLIENYSSLSQLIASITAAEYEKKSQRARDYILENYSWQSYANQLNAAYQKVYQSSRA